MFLLPRRGAPDYASSQATKSNLCTCPQQTYTKVQILTFKQKQAL